MAADHDERIGQALASLRGGRSQKALAKEMRDRGWKWSQTTVWSVERGARPLKLAEAQSLAAIFGTEISSLLDDRSDIQIREAIYECEVGERQIRSDSMEFLAAQARLKDLLSGVRAQGKPTADYDDWLEQTPERIAAAARSLWRLDTEAERPGH